MLTRNALLRLFWTVLFVGISVMYEVKLKEVTISIQLPELCEQKIDTLKAHELQRLKNKVEELIRDEMMNLRHQETWEVPDRQVDFDGV